MHTINNKKAYGVSGLMSYDEMISAPVDKENHALQIINRANPYYIYYNRDTILYTSTRDMRTFLKLKYDALTSFKVAYKKLIIKATKKIPDAMNNIDKNYEELVNLLCGLYAYSVYPTKYDILQHIRDTIYMYLNMLTSPDQIPIQEILTTFVSMFDPILSISQQKLCSKFTGVFYNFVCRYIGSTSEGTIAPGNQTYTINTDLSKQYLKHDGDPVKMSYAARKLTPINEAIANPSYGPRPLASQANASNNVGKVVRGVIREHIQTSKLTTPLNNNENEQKIGAPTAEDRQAPVRRHLQQMKQRRVSGISKKIDELNAEIDKESILRAQRTGLQKAIDYELSEDQINEYIHKGYSDTFLFKMAVKAQQNAYPIVPNPKHRAYLDEKYRPLLNELADKIDMINRFKTRREGLQYLLSPQQLDEYVQRGFNDNFLNAVVLSKKRMNTKHVANKHNHAHYIKTVGQNLEKKYKAKQTKKNSAK
jgi:hypothetical protein